MTLDLRPTKEEDLPALFRHQDDAAAHALAGGGTLKADEASFAAHVKTARDKGASFTTILFDGDVVGYVASFDRLGKREVSYWIGREYSGRGIASRALVKWLEGAALPVEGLFARVAKDHPVSIRVLEKAGFTCVDEDSYFSEARGAQAEEWLYRLGA